MKLKNTVNNVRKKIADKAYLMAGGITTAIILSPVGVYADALSSADDAAKGITKFGGDMTKKIIPIVVLGLGIALFIGGQRAREGVKEGAPWKIGGLILIFGAAAFGATIGGWFN